MRTVLRYLLGAAIAALVVSGARASDWTTTDRALLASALVLHAADWSQTLQIADQPDRYFERNPILGRHPSRGEVHAYFAATALALVLIADALPQYRRPMLGGWIAVQAIVVHNNLGIGLRIGF